MSQAAVAAAGSDAAAKPSPPSSLLIAASLEPSTRRRYDSAARDYEQWAADSGLVAVPTTSAELDQQLTAYFDNLWTSNPGHLRGKAVHTLAALRKQHPSLTRDLPFTRQALQGYERKQPTTQRPPMPWKVAVAIGVHIAATGHARMGIGIVLAHHCMLRVSELCAIKKEDVLVTGDSRIDLDDDAPRAFVRLAKTKSGRNRSVDVLEPGLVAVLAQLMDGTSAGDRLFPYVPDTFNAVLDVMCDKLGLRKYTMHSLRHGGATKLYIDGWSVADICQRGRWKQQGTLDNYVQTSVGIAAMMAVPRAVAQFGVICAKDLPAAFAAALPQKHGSS